MAAKKQKTKNSKEKTRKNLLKSQNADKGPQKAGEKIGKNSQLNRENADNASKKNHTRDRESSAEYSLKRRNVYGDSEENDKINKNSRLSRQNLNRVSKENDISIENGGNEELSHQNIDAVSEENIKIRKNKPLNQRNIDKISLK